VRERAVDDQSSRHSQVGPLVSQVNEVDFVVVGTGIGGLTAAIVAADAGLSVLLVERSDLVGGVLSVTQGEVWVAGTSLERDAGIEDSVALGAQYLEAMDGGYADREMQARLLEMAPVVLDHLAEQAGVRWRLLRGMPDYYFGYLPGTLGEGRYVEVDPLPGAVLGPWRERLRLSPYFPARVTGEEVSSWGGMAGLANWDMGLMAAREEQDALAQGAGVAAYLVKAALVDRDIPVRLGTRAVALRASADGRVTGLDVTGPDGVSDSITARCGVLLATGGYEWSTELTRSHEQLPEYFSACPPIVTGDGLSMAVDAGAELVTLPPIGQASFFGYHLPGEENEGQPLWRAALETALPHSLIVNRDGERFTDESFYRDNQARYRAFDNKQQRYLNRPAYLIFDQTHRERYPLGPVMPGKPLPDGAVSSAGSLGELAAEIGVSPDGLLRTVERFNGFADAGSDPDFGRGTSPWSRFFLGDRTYPNPNLGRLENPPFYALELSVGGAGVGAAGLRIDTDGRVQRRGGGPIPGLYATGNAAANTDIGLGYNSGFANARGMTWGYLAARHAAAVRPQ
jgi:3-oxosteroid 1-dehydrogenase